MKNKDLHKVVKLGHYDGWGSEAIPAPRSNSETEKANFSYQINEIHLKDTQIKLNLTHQTGESKIALLNQKIINFENGTDIYNSKINELNNDIQIRLNNLNSLGANISDISTIQNKLHKNVEHTLYLINNNSILKTNPEGFSKIDLQEKIIQNLKEINYYKNIQIDILLKLKTTLNKKYSSLLKIEKKYTDHLIVEKNSEKSDFTDTYIKTSNYNLLPFVERTIIEGIDLSNGLEDSEIAILRRQPDEKIKELEINDYAKINEILNNGFKGATKSDIALFQIYAKQNGNYLKSKDDSYNVDGILGKGSRYALANLKYN